MKRLTIERCPGIELIVAFADQGEDHHGGIYQASNFVYTGTSEIVRLFKHKDTETILHNRAVICERLPITFWTRRKSSAL